MFLNGLVFAPLLPIIIWFLSFLEARQPLSATAAVAANRTSRALPFRRRTAGVVQVLVILALVSRLPVETDAQRLALVALAPSCRAFFTRLAWVGVLILEVTCQALFARSSAVSAELSLVAGDARRGCLGARLPSLTGDALSGRWILAFGPLLACFE